MLGLARKCGFHLLTGHVGDGGKQVTQGQESLSVAAVAEGEAQSKERVATTAGGGWATIVRTHWSAWEELTLPSSQLFL